MFELVRAGCTRMRTVRVGVLKAHPLLFTCTGDMRLNEALDVVAVYI